MSAWQTAPMSDISVLLEEQLQHIGGRYFPRHEDSTRGLCLGNLFELLGLCKVPFAVFSYCLFGMLPFLSLNLLSCTSEMLNVFIYSKSQFDAVDFLQKASASMFVNSAAERKVSCSQPTFPSF